MTILDYLSAAIATMLVVVDPPGLGPIFLGVTRGMSKEQRHSVGWRAGTIGFGVLAFFAVAGEPFLRLLGITTPAFRIAGGLLLFAIAFEMVFDRSQVRKNETAETAITKDFISNVAAFPLAIPLIAGPGAITGVMLLSAQAHGDPLKFGVLFLVLAFVTLCCFVSFKLADVINKLLGITGNVVLTRLLGIVLAALAVQFMVDGVRTIIAG
jgi:multiple antibiotic resistance protein